MSVPFAILMGTGLRNVNWSQSGVILCRFFGSLKKEKTSSRPLGSHRSGSYTNSRTPNFPSATGCGKWRCEALFRAEYQPGRACAPRPVGSRVAWRSRFGREPQHIDRYRIRCGRGVRALRGAPWLVHAARLRDQNEALTIASSIADFGSMLAEGCAKRVIDCSGAPVQSVAGK